MKFRDREDAGRQLAALLEGHRGQDPIVLALPRGGVPVAYQVARALGAPLEVLVARKIASPLFPEYALGAIAEGGAVFVDPAALREAGVSDERLGDLAEREAAELARRVRLYRGDRPLPPIRDRTAILVDDGIATGRTARAAIRALRALRPRRLVLAAPVVAAETAAEIRPEVDELVYVTAPERFMAVGLWYEHFGQTPDEEVVALLEAARRELGAPGRGAAAPDPPDPPRDGAGAAPEAEERELAVPAGDREVRADLRVPPRARGLVVFAHGSGSSRKSPRNLHVARSLCDAGFATLLPDLMTPEEEALDRLSGWLGLDVAFLARRLAAATAAALEQEPMRRLRVGYFGSSTGAAAALVAAAELPVVSAVVCRGGRPDLVGPGELRRVRVPTLLVVGGEDREVLELNRAALEQLGGERRLAVVPGAGHLFEEPGALDVVADLAAGWFSGRLS
jgi:putative phosphoribosyl transferase